MADEENPSITKLRAVLRRFNQVWPKYVPYCGVTGYFTLSTNALHLPLVKQVLKADTSRVFTNCCFALSHAGLAVYIHHRPSFGVFPCKERLLYSLFGSTIFNLGSVLSWSVLQVGLPKDELGKSLVGLACSLTYLYIGYRYLRSVDIAILRSYKAGQRKLAEEEGREVRERLENSHLDYEDQEIQLDFDDEIFSRQNSLAEGQLTVEINEQDSS